MEITKEEFEKGGENFRCDICLRFFSGEFSLLENKKYRKSDGRRYVKFCKECQEKLKKN